MSKRSPPNTADAGGIWVPAPRGGEGRRIRGWRPGAPGVHPRWARGVGEGGEGPRGRGALTRGELGGCAQFSGKGRGVAGAGPGAALAKTPAAQAFGPAQPGRSSSPGAAGDQRGAG